MAADAVPNGTRRRPAEVRKLLLEAAERVVTRKGMSASAQEIAIEAGVHRSVLYRHFGGTQELIQMAALRPFHELQDKIREMTAHADETPPKSLWDLMVGFLDDLLDILFEHRDFLIMAMSQSSPFDDENRRELRQQLDGVLDGITELAVQAGSSRDLELGTVRINVRLAIAMAAGVSSFGGWLLPDNSDPTDRAALVEQMATVLFYGVRIRPGDETAGPA